MDKSKSRSKLNSESKPKSKPKSNYYATRNGTRIKIKMHGYEWFKERVLRWVDFFGLSEWSIWIEFVSSPSGNQFAATSSSDWSSKSATITLYKYWEKCPYGLDSIKFYLDRTAFHEVFHVVLAELRYLAYERSFSDATWSACEEGIVRKMENSIFAATVGKPLFVNEDEATADKDGYRGETVFRKELRGRGSQELQDSSESELESDERTHEEKSERGKNVSEISTTPVESAKSESSRSFEDISSAISSDAMSIEESIRGKSEKDLGEVKQNLGDAKQDLGEAK